MAYVTPDGEIKLISGYPCDNTYNHTLFFTSTTQQYNTISALARYTLTARTYQRWDNKTLRVGMVADLLYDCNYMMFRNTHYSSDRWFYAFINRITYINDNCTEIEYEIDDMQSWLGDWTLLPSFVEREHAASDAIGENLVEEDLQVGDYMVKESENYTFPGSIPDQNRMVILVAYSMAPQHQGGGGLITWDPSQNIWVIDSTVKPAGTAHGGIVSGVAFVPITFIKNDQPTLTQAIYRLSQLIDLITSSTSGMNVVAIWELPYLTYSSAIGPESATVYNWDLNRPVVFPGAGKQRPYPDTDAGETIRNNKLLTYPYCALTISNNDGNSQEYHWEYFKNPSGAAYDARFYVNALLQPAPVVSLYPTNYKGKPSYYEAGLELQTFVDNCWSEDSFARWWSQNKNTYGMGIMSSVFNFAMGGMSMLGGNFLGGAAAMGGAAASLGQTLGNKLNAMATPDNVRGSLVSNGSKLVQDRQTFTAYSYMITAEKARMIDDFFTMYGYKTNRVKVPNMDVRERWCYTKTNGCKIHAVTNAAVEKHIEDIFDHGITFWRDWEHVGDYTQSNGVRT